MRSAVILTLGLGVFGATLVNAEKIVFVVPRYIRRSHQENSVPPYENAYKTRRESILGPKRPHFGGNYVGTNPTFRVPQDGGDFHQGYYPTSHREVNHVEIPHGKGITHGVSFGKPYVPRGEFEPAQATGIENQGEFKFGNEGQPSFREPVRDSGAWNYGEWDFPARGHVSGNHEQEANREESRIELRDSLRNQGLPMTSGEETPTDPGENVSRGIPGDASPNPAAVTLPTERKREPIILRDTVDMKEYVEKIEAFARSWPPAAALRGFAWKNQMLDRPGSTFPAGYQGFNSWSSKSPFAMVPTGGYQVREEPAEKPSQRSFGEFFV